MNKGAEISESIHEVASALDAILSVLDFDRLADDVADGKHFITWNRQAAWKKDVVQLVFPVQNLDALFYLEIVLRVRMVLSDGQEAIFDGVNLRDLVSKPRSYYYPRRHLWLFGPLSYRRVCREIVRDLKTALSWFASYRDVASCVAKLRSGQTSLGPIEDGKASGRAYSFLMRLGNS